MMMMMMCTPQRRTCPAALLLLVLVVVVVVVACGCVRAAPSTGKRCGTNTCDLLQYCSPLHEQCVPCDSICSVTHNYNPEMCASNCEHYLQEQRSADLAGAIHQLQTQQTITLTLLIVLAVLFVLVNGMQVFRWLRRHDRLSFKWLKTLRSASSGNKTLAPDQLTHSNPHTQSPRAQRAAATTANLTLGALQNGAGPALRVVQRQSSMAAFSEDGPDNLSTVNTVSTPISRHPAEDSTDTFSYDNAGLQVTPTSNMPPKSETTF